MLDFWEKRILLQIYSNMKNHSVIWRYQLYQIQN